MKVNLLFVSFLIFSIQLSRAQAYFEIRDLESNNILAGATVLLEADSTTFFSDEKGKVNLINVNDGSLIRISYVGYKTLLHYYNASNKIIYLEPNYQTLNSLSVIGYENNHRLYEVAGSYVINSSNSMARFNDESLVRSMNTLPGIRFEERSPSSYRISIRGNLLRSPYGIRNVKVYWNGIPYTDPSGSTSLNLLDLNNMNKVEVLKGPAGSIYGMGIGGVINITSELKTIKPLTAEFAYSAGSYGFQKIVANINSANKDYRFSIRFVNQKANGYRDHSASTKSIIQMSGSLFTSLKRTLKAQLVYSDLFYQLPGGLTQEQYDKNPIQARPGVAEKNSSLSHQNFFAGLVQDYRWNDKIENTTAIFLTNGTKENPFITNYELTKMQSYGGRTTFNIYSHIANLPFEINTGAELVYGIQNASNHGNVAGHADTLRFEDELKSLQSFVFLKATLRLFDNWIVSAGASLNFQNVDINRLIDVANDTTYQVHRNFDPELIPKIGLVGKLSDLFSVHASISTGFSPPNIEEIRSSDGTINTDLNSEKGISYEIGLRGNNRKNSLYYDLSLFWMQQKESIVSKSTEQGTVIYENAGSTSQLGLELLLGYTFINKPENTLSLITIQTAYTRNNFRFKDYSKRKGNENIDYSGNDLTGTAPNISVSTFDLELKQGFYFNFTYNFTDEIPLNDANSVYSKNYQLMSLKTGWKIKIKQKHVLDLFVGIDNILNEKYSLGNDLNPFGGRYYNAAPTRNYFGGLKMYLNVF